MVEDDSDSLDIAALAHQSKDRLNSFQNPWGSRGLA